VTALADPLGEALPDGWADPLGEIKQDELKGRAEEPVRATRE
jgi:hypothetical protein